MADLEEMALENLKEWIFDENKIVTFKWLSLTLSMHVNQSKKILETFVKRNKDNPGCQLSVVYCVSGLVKTGEFEVYKVELMTEESVKNVETTFIPPVSCHIYSVQSSTPKNFANLYIADYDLIKENIFSSNKFSAIQCASAVMRTRSVEEVPLKLIHEEPSSVLTKKEEKAKPSAARKGVSSFFDKQNKKTSVISNGNSNSTSSVVQKPGPTIPEQPSKPSANISSCDKNNLADSVPPAKSSRVENGNEKSQKVSEKENKTGKRKRLRIAEISSSEEEENEEQDMRIEMTEEMNHEDEDVREKIVADVGERVRETGDANNQKKGTKKLVSKTYVNDEGFMVTEKVWETSEEAMDVSEEKAPKPPVQKPDATAATAAAAHPSTMSKKKAQPQKGNKQSSLMKFFNKQ